MTSLELSAVLLQQPLGLVFDIDGTLSSLVALPEVARLYPGVAPLLEQARQYAHVAIMTGRALADAASIVNVDGLTYIGTHGLEWCDGLPNTHQIHLIPEAIAYVEPGTRLLDLAERQLADIPGLIVQRKQVGGTIHYRNVSDPVQARQCILSLLQKPAQELHLRLREGKYIVEVLTPLAVNKGQALRRYVQHIEARGVLFAGDDLTDLDAVLEIARLRQEGLAALSVVVRHADTLPALLEHADLIVDGVPGMAHLLGEIVEILQQQRQGRREV
jgi:trehalose 6-phosphate phosphatase